MSYLLRLYVTGKSGHSVAAIRNLERLCAEELKSDYEIEVIDVLEHPQLAEDEKILATPTLVRRLPTPMRKIIGDLSRLDQVLIGLDLVPRGSSSQEEP
jgi:circadian clock protein KaiB